MSFHSVPPGGELTPEDRRRQIAAILVEGVIRHRRAAQLAKVGQFSPSGDTGLEVVSKTRLSVSRRLDSRVGVGRREVNDGRNA
jgi:hypothetical protein